MNGWSFHSVKGGVGKSTLSTFTALSLARRYPGSPVYLVDLDLTGTSLADGLPLCAPRLKGTPGALKWEVAGAPLGVDEGRHAMIARQEAWRTEPFGPPHAVPFLNDWLLWNGSDENLPLPCVTWQLEGGPPNLHVLPSSALPGDLKRTIPVVFDEEFSSFFEARLEHLLAGMPPDAHVVVDVPPTIPGLSRAVLGVALRLSAVPPIPLALDGFIPAPLDGGLRWRAALVTTFDTLDIRAMNRWIGLVTLEERSRAVRVVINRAPDPPPSLERIFGGSPVLDDPLAFGPDNLAAAPGRESRFEPALAEAIHVPDHVAMRIFQLGARLDAPPEFEKIVDALDR